MLKILSILSCLFVVSSISAQLGLLRVEIEKIIQFDTDIKYTEIPGFIIGVVDEDSTYIMSFGTRLNSKDSLTEDDIFELGSISKSFTSTLINILAKNKTLRLDDKVNDYLDEPSKNPRMKWLTIEDLVNHTSGLPKRPLGFGLKEIDVQNPYQNFTREDLLKFYAYYVPEVKDRSVFEYSHTNYALLEVIIEKVTNMTFEDNIRNQIFNPLGMNNSLVDYYEKKLNLLTPGMDRSGEAVKPWTFRSFTASEGIKSTMHDMLTYMRSLIDEKQTNNPSFELNDVNRKGKKSFSNDIMVQDGWQLLKVNKKITAHINSGSTSGHSAFMALVKDTHTGVIILSNSAFGTGDLPLLILRMVNYNWKRKPKHQ